MTKNSLTNIGRAERVDFPKLGIKNIPAKIDTGADSSSIWASYAKVNNNKILECILFSKVSPYYTGHTIKFNLNEYIITRVANSFGHKEVRYKVKLLIKVRGRLINGTFTLANRASKTYPILLGRRILHKKFIVDVAKGKPLLSVEKSKKQALQEYLKEFSV